MVTTNTPQAANVSLFKKLNYDPVKDFAPIARLGTISFMIMVRPDFPAKNFKEFLAHAKANPGKLSAGYGSAGSQVSQAMLRSMGKIDFVDVPYKGLPQAITDVLGGSIHFTFADLANALAQIKGEAARPRGHLAEALAARARRAGDRRRASWLRAHRVVRARRAGEHARPGRHTAARHHGEVARQAGSEGAVRLARHRRGAPESGGAGRFIRSEIEKWAKMAKEAGIQPGRKKKRWPVRSPASASSTSLPS